MGRNPKFLISEIDGEDLAYAEEYTPFAEDVVMSSTDPRTVKSAVTSLEDSGGLPFDVNRTISDTQLIKAYYYKMVVDPIIEGQLIIDGSLVVL